MAQSKQFEMVLNFVAQLDKSKVADIVNQLQTLSKQSKLELGFDKQALVKEFENLSKVIDQISKNAKGLDVNIDLTKALKDFDKFSIEIDKVLNSDLGKAFDNIDLSGLDKSINEIDKAVSNIDMNELEKSMENLKAPETAFDGLTKGMTDAKTKSKELEGNLAKMVLEGKKGTPEFIKMEQELKLANLEATKMEGALKSVSKEASSASSFTDKMAKFGLASQGVQQLASGIQDLAQPFIALDTATQKIKTLGGDAKALAPAFREMSLAMSNELGVSATSVQEATYDALSAGIKATKEDIGAFMDTATKLAIGGSETIGNTVNVISSQINAYGMKATEASKVSDILFNTANVGKTTIPELSASLASVIPTASAMGVSLDNVGASLAVMTAKGIPTAQSTTKLNALLVELQKPGAALAPILTKAGISLDSLKNEGLPANLGRISEALKKAGVTATQAFSSTEASSAFNTLGGDIVGFTNALDIVSNTAGSTNEAFASMSDGIENRTNAIKNKVDNLITEGMGKLGNSFTVVASSAAKLAPTVTTLSGLGQALPLKAMNDFRKVFKEVEGANGEMVKQVVGNKSMQTMFTDIATKGKGAVTSLGSSLKSLGPMLANPYVLAGAGLALFLTQTEAGKKLMSKLGDVGTEIMQKLKPIGDWLTKVFLGTFDFIGEALANIGELLVSEFTAMFDVFSAIGGIVFDLYKSFFDFVGITAIFNDLFGAIGGGGDKFATLEGAVATFFDYLSKIPLAFALIFDSISGLAKNAPEIISALGELIKIELNPANWFGEDGEAEAKAKEKLANVLGKAFDGAKQRIANYQLGEALDKAMESKKKIDKSAELEKLAKDFATTTDEIKKGDIATKIAEMAPEAVKGYRTIVNAQGEMVQVADINIKKVNELAEAQKKAGTTDYENSTKSLSASLKKQADEYDNAKKKSSELADQIVQGGLKGIDTSKQQKEYDLLQKDITDKSKNITKTLNEASKAKVTVTGVDLPDSFTTDFADQVKKVVTSPELKQATDGLSEIMKLKGNLDSGNSLDKLMVKFKEAKTDAERENIAKVIQKSAPDAVKAIGTITDEQGNVVTQYAISSEAVTNYANKVKSETEGKILEAQKKVKEGLNAEADNYDKLKVKLVAKQKEINDAKANGKDTTALQKEADDLQVKVNTSGQALVKAVAEGKTAGVESAQVYDKMATSMGKSPIEVKKMIDLQIKSTEEAKKQAESVTSLAKKWDEAKSAVDGQVKAQVSAIAQINKELADKGTSKERRAELLKQRADDIKAGREAVTQQKNAQKLEEESGKLIGLNAKTAIEQLKLEFENKKAKLEIEKQIFDNVQNQNILLEGRQKNINDEFVMATKSLEIENRKLNTYTDILKTKGLISDIKADGSIVFTSKVKSKVEQSEIQKTYLDLNKSLLDNRASLEAIQLKVKADSKEVQKLRDDLEKQIFQTELEIGIKTPADVFQKTIISLNKEGANVQTELDVISAKLSKSKIDLDSKLSKMNIDSMKLIAKQTLDNAKESIIKATEGFGELTNVYINYNDKVSENLNLKSEAQRKTGFNAINKSFDAEIATTKSKVTNFATVFGQISTTLKEQGLQVNEATFQTLQQKYQDSFSIAEKAQIQVKSLEEKRQIEVANIEKEYIKKNSKADKLAKEEKISLVNENYKKEIDIAKTFNVDFASLNTQMVNELSVYLAKLPEEQKNMMLSSFDSTNKELIKSQIDLQKQLMDIEKSKREKIKAEYDRQINDIKDAESAKLTALQSSYDLQNNALNHFLETYNSTYKVGQDNHKAQLLKNAEDTGQAEQKKLDKYKEIGTISELEYNDRIEQIKIDSDKRKSEIEKKFVNEQFNLDNFAKGQLLFEQNKFEANKAQIEIDSNTKQLEVFKKMLLEQAGAGKDQYTKLAQLQEEYLQAQKELANNQADENAKQKATNAKLALDTLTAKTEEDKKKQKLIEDNFGNLQNAQSEFNKANQEYLKDSQNKEKKANMELRKEKLDALTKQLGLNEEQKKALAGNVNGLDEANKLLKDKGDILNQTYAEMGTVMSDAITKMVAGDPDAIKNGFKALFGVIVGALQEYLKLVVGKLVLDWLIDPKTAFAGSPLVKLALTPIIYATVGAGVKAVTDPIFNSVLSFASGGRIDSPTLAMVGDGAKLGSQNREWIFNDPQLISTVQMAVNGQNKGLENELRDIKRLLSSQEISTRLRGSDIEIAVRRTKIDNMRLAR